MQQRGPHPEEGWAPLVLFLSGEPSEGLGFSNALEQIFFHLHLARWKRRCQVKQLLLSMLPEGFFHALEERRLRRVLFEGFQFGIEPLSDRDLCSPRRQRDWFA